jgi:hypothetical protein
MHNLLKHPLVRLTTLLALLLLLLLAGFLLLLFFLLRLCWKGLRAMLLSRVPRKARGGQSKTPT